MAASLNLTLMVVGLGGNRSRPRGFTLAELVVGIGLFAILSLALMSGTVATRMSSESNVRETTATTVAVGYLEQMRSMEFSALRLSANDPSVPLPTEINRGEPDPLFLNVFNEKTLVLDEDDEGNPTMSMIVEFMPVIRLQEMDEDTAIAGMEMVYRWEVEGRRTSERSLRTARSTVPTY